MAVREAGRVADLSFGQFWNAEQPTDVTGAGISMDSSKAWRNACGPTDVRVEGSDTDARRVHSANALVSRVVTPSGI